MFDIFYSKASYPKLRVVLIQSFWRKEEKKVTRKIATGILLSNQIVLTSAQNIYLKQFGSVASDLRIFFQDQQDEKINSKNISVLLKVQLQKNVFLKLEPQEKGYTYDLALIRLKWLKEIQIQLPIFIAFRQQPKKSRINKTRQVFISGYPDQKAQENIAVQQNNDKANQKALSKLVTERGIFDRDEGNYIYYKQTKTVIGQSGGPIFIQDEGKLYLIGIHTEYNANTKTGRGLVLNEFIWGILVQWGLKLQVNLQICCRELYRQQPIIQVSINLNQDSQNKQKKSTFLKCEESLEKSRQSVKADSLIKKGPQNTLWSALHNAKQKMSQILSSVKAQIKSLQELVRQLDQKISELNDDKSELQKSQASQILKIINEFDSKRSCCTKKLNEQIIDEDLERVFLPFDIKLSQIRQEPKKEEEEEEENSICSSLEMDRECPSFETEKRSIDSIQSFKQYFDIIYEQTPIQEFSQEDLAYYEEQYAKYFQQNEKYVKPDQPKVIAVSRS